MEEQGIIRLGTPHEPLHCGKLRRDDELDYDLRVPRHIRCYLSWAFDEDWWRRRLGGPYPHDDNPRYLNEDQLVIGALHCLATYLARNG